VLPRGFQKCMLLGSSNNDLWSFCFRQTLDSASGMPVAAHLGISASFDKCRIVRFLHLLPGCQLQSTSDVPHFWRSCVVNLEPRLAPPQPPPEFSPTLQLSHRRKWGFTYPSTNSELHRSDDISELSATLNSGSTAIMTITISTRFPIPIPRQTNTHLQRFPAPPPISVYKPHFQTSNSHPRHKNS
jgi:hypothetical protein